MSNGGDANLKGAGHQMQLQIQGNFPNRDASPNRPLYQRYNWFSVPGCHTMTTAQNMHQVHTRGQVRRSENPSRLGQRHMHNSTLVEPADTSVFSRFLPHIPALPSCAIKPGISGILEHPNPRRWLNSIK
ncbi:uncharacterized protein UDID_17303 [Ustilago sp. UG-2017a]|nr:uncharacterized protein UDID_17303 [Ustilago sp. UG-2017a]